MLNAAGFASWTACLAAFAALRVLFTRPPRGGALWGGLLGLVFLVGAQPAAAVCMNNQVAWPGGYGIRDTGLYVPFYQVNNPPRYCYEWKVRYQDYGDWIYNAGCNDMANNQVTFDWVTLQAQGSSVSNPGDTGYFKVRARSDVPACGYQGTWSIWTSFTFTVPGSD